MLILSVILIYRTLPIVSYTKCLKNRKLLNIFGKNLHHRRFEGSEMAIYIPIFSPHATIYGRYPWIARIFGISRIVAKLTQLSLNLKRLVGQLNTNLWLYVLICDALHDLVPFVEFAIAEAWKLPFLHGCFSCFLNCTNCAK